MSSFENRLKDAFKGLAERTQRRAARIKELVAQPQTQQTATSIAAEKREIKLVQETAAATTAVFTELTAALENAQGHAEAIRSRVLPLAQEAEHFENLLFFTLDRMTPDPPPDKTPPLVIAGNRVLARMYHLRTSPATYAATYPPPFPALPHVARPS